MQEMKEQGLLQIAAEDAALRNITSGDPVRVFNDEGQVMLKARVNSIVQPGVVSAKLNWPKDSGCSEHKQLDLGKAHRSGEFGHFSFRVGPSRIGQSEGHTFH
jgi:anaerobic dimethyl sulfoxide reductase subunit A